jgi:Ca2+-binding EF-hand superfamily protein
MNRCSITLTGFILIQTLTATGQTPEKVKPAPQKLPPRLAELFQGTPENFIKRFDKNKDGMLSKAELPPFLAKAFPKFDINGDGQLDSEEVARMFKIIRQRFGIEAGKAPTAPAKADIENIEKIVSNLLKKFDTDMDGKISKKEAKGQLLQDFDRIDANKDGFLDRGELRVLATRMLANKRGPGKEGGKPHPLPPPDFDALDANADGRLTKDELKGSPLLKHFDEIDTNRDGRIDRREFEAYMKKQTQAK